MSTQKNKIEVGILGVGNVSAEVTDENSKRVGGFLKKICGDMIIDGVGLAHDRLRFFRWKNTVKLQERAEKILKDRGVGNTRQIPPKLALPLLEEASMEDNDSLQDLWARLLANSMDPSRAVTLQRSYISVLSELLPLEAMILNAVVSEFSRSGKRNSEIHFSRELLAKNLNKPVLEVDASLHNLLRLGCIMPGIVTVSGISLGGQSPTAYKGTELFHVSPFGVGLATAAMT